MDRQDMAAAALVIGLGSIGIRHVRILRDLGLEVSAVSRRGSSGLPDDLQIPVHDDLALGLGPEVGYVVVANDTAEHGTTLGRLAELGFEGRVMVEKPILAEPTGLPINRFSGMAVAYQLRRHPGLLQLRHLLADEPVLTASIYCGQHLPTWRPGRDYRTGYSASADRGGGALRDLSHELDYALWLLGAWRRVTALGGHFGSLEIASDDAFVLLLETERCRALSLEVNYLDRRPRRMIELRTDSRTLTLDFIAGRLEQNGETMAEISPPRDAVIADLHRQFLAGRSEELCSAAEGLAVTGLAAAAERAAAAGIWIHNEPA
jgi:predicted dehydrogenase